MSHAHTEIENGLHGRETYLRDSLAEALETGNPNFVPDWLNYGDSEAVIDALESARKTARRRQEDIGTVGFPFYWTEDADEWTRTEGMMIGTRTRSTTAPNTIQERCREFTHNATERRMGDESDCEFEVEVKVGPSGDIHDVRLVAGRL